LNAWLVSVVNRIEVHLDEIEADRALRRRNLFGPVIERVAHNIEGILIVTADLIRNRSKQIAWNRLATDFFMFSVAGPVSSMRRCPASAPPGRPEFSAPLIMRPKRSTRAIAAHEPA
jgi:hypothetical protein